VLLVIRFVEGFWMRPSEGKEPLAFHFLHDGFPFDVLVAGVGHVAARDLALHERAIDFHAKPLAEFAIVRQCPPDARDWRFQFDALLDSIAHLLATSTLSNGQR